MGDKKPTIAIAGAGIAGLTAALCLEKAGFLVKIFEKSAYSATSGTGIQLSPNGFKVLANLGHDLNLGDKLEKAGFVPASIEIGDGLNGGYLTSFTLGDTIRARHGASYLVLHRTVLAELLETACRGRERIEISRDAPVSNVEFDGAETKISVNGKVMSVDALIGADGTWSTLRTHVPNAIPPQFTGRVAWRTVIRGNEFPTNLPSNATGLWLGPDAHFVHYPLQDDESYNVVAITPWRGAQPPERGWINDPDEAIRTLAFADWHSPLRELANMKGGWGGWPIYSVPETGAFSHKSLCLIGDAAHTMVPYGAQGGSAAIEDASVLAYCCARNARDLPLAFKTFDMTRQSRVQRILNLSNNNRRIYHMGWPVKMARNLGMQFAPQEVMQKRMDWLYGWEPPTV